MAYSTIKNKKCKCGCGKNKSMGYAGYYYKCAPEKIKAEVEAKTREQRRKQRKSLQSKVRSLAPIDEHKAEETEHDLWYRMQMQVNEKVCDNCGLSLAHYNEWAWRSSQHHVLEKSLFPTVKTNPVNHLVLGVYCCHSQFHTSMLNASKMPVFVKAKEIVKLLYPLLAQEEKRRISEYYGILD